MPRSLSRRSSRYSRRASRSGISLSAKTSPPSATNRTTCREIPRCGISVIRSSVQSSSGWSHGRSSRPAAASAGGLNTKCTGRPRRRAGQGTNGSTRPRWSSRRGTPRPPSSRARRRAPLLRRPLLGEPGGGAAAAAPPAAGLDARPPPPPPLDVGAGDQAVGVVHPEPTLLPGPPAAVLRGGPLRGLGEVAVEGLVVVGDVGP